MLPKVAHEATPFRIIPCPYQNEKAFGNTAQHGKARRRCNERTRVSLHGSQDSESMCGKYLGKKTRQVRQMHTYRHADMHEWFWKNILSTLPCLHAYLLETKKTQTFPPNFERAALKKKKKEKADKIATRDWSAVRIICISLGENVNKQTLCCGYLL